MQFCQLFRGVPIVSSPLLLFDAKVAQGPSEKIASCYTDYIRYIIFPCIISLWWLPPEIYILIYRHFIIAQSSHIHTVCPGRSDPFYIVTYYIKWVTTSWTYSIVRKGDISVAISTTVIQSFSLPYLSYCRLLLISLRYFLKASYPVRWPFRYITYIIRYIATSY